MPLLNGLEACEQVKALLPEVKVIFVTMYTHPEVAAEAFRRGASAYLSKSVAAEELVTALHEVQRGKAYLSLGVDKGAVQNVLRSSWPEEIGKQLTPRQREILQLLAAGKTMREAAQVLGLRPGTIAFHKYRIMVALGLKSNAELMQYAIRHHLIPE
jgi:DNA-binding NarL/FixJ family response regulator